MCGIYATTLNYEKSQVIDKLKRTSFRGPDQMGYSQYKLGDNKVTFGHNRLTIIDLDPRSNQPFSYAGHIHIVFNGEIYNFKTVKEVLHKKGYEFKTTSDTEVICAAYLEYGDSCVNHFNGMFSFVLLDEKKKKLFGARDRLGKKPFYYFHDGKKLEIASQLSSIQLHQKNKLSISRKAIAYFLAWGNIADPQSIFNEIKKLPPGHVFNFDLNSGNLDIKRYWDIDITGQNKFLGSYDQAKRQLNNLLQNAVSERLFADVPVGVFLSGGVDSSLVAAIASRTSSKKVKTFSVKFDEEEFDESEYSQKVADHIDSDHHVIKCNYDEGLDLISTFSHYYDEPFSDPSAIPSMLLAKYTKKHVTVALSGDGGDESFIGYQRYQWVKYRSRIYDIPKPLRNLGSNLLGLSPIYSHKVMAQGLKIKDANSAYLSVMTGIDLSWIETDIDFRDFEQLKYLNHKNKNLMERVSDFDIKTYLNWEINTKVDRATMAYSLEARAPLMDHHIVDFARSLPTEFKYGPNHNQKRILKDVLYDYVPAEFFDRPKAGFGVPFSRWFREDLKDFVLSELDDQSLKSLPNINISEVKFRIKQHMDGKWDRNPMIWKLLVLKQWLNNNGKGYSIE